MDLAKLLAAPLFFASYLVFLIGWSMVLNVPVLGLAWVLRHGAGGRRLRQVLPVTFAAGVGYALYRVEWFDVWRHGVPPVTYLIGYLPFLLVGAAAGWWVARCLTGSSIGSRVAGDGV